MFKIGIDVGGTFTDFVVAGEDGQPRFFKTQSTPDDPSLGVMAGLGEAAVAYGLSLEQLLGDTDLVIHGSTVATNTLVERKGARVGLVTTDGFRDLLEMREGLKEDRYNLRMTPVEPLAHRYLRVGVPERVRASGAVEQPLDEAALAESLDYLDREGAEALAVCFLFSYLNPDHERRAGEIIRQRFPDTYASLSHQVIPQIKEFDRLSTTVINSYVGPVFGRYLSHLAERFAAYPGLKDVLIMQSNGGVAPIEDSGRMAVRAILSGPAGGVSAAAHIGQQLDEPRIIAFDMGGTSTDISLIEKGVPHITNEKFEAGWKIAVPMIDIHTLGAGGGSIAPGRRRRHSPRGPRQRRRRARPGLLWKGRRQSHSHRRQPGPGLPGRRPTSWADGLPWTRPPPRRPCRNTWAPRWACPLRRPPMARTRWSAPPSPRASGSCRCSGAWTPGTSPSWASAAPRASTPPRWPANFRWKGSTFPPRRPSCLPTAMLNTDIKYDFSRSYPASLDRLGLDEARAVLDDLASQGRDKLLTQGVPKEALELQYSADMRYLDQIYEVTVPLPDLNLPDTQFLAQLTANFHRRYQELYAYNQQDQEVRLVTLRVTAVGKLPRIAQVERTDTEGVAAPVGSRRVYLGDWQDAPIYAADSLPAGTEIKGPAILESDFTTILVWPGDLATVDALSGIVLRVNLEMARTLGRRSRLPLKRMPVTGLPTPTPSPWPWWNTGWSPSPGK